MKQATPITLSRMRRGFTMLEMTVSLSILGAIFILVFQVMQMMADGFKYSQGSSDATTRSSGAMYDIVSEIRQATAYSPNFYIEQDINKPPSITFDLVSDVDSKGNIIWGNKINYSLKVMAYPQASNFDYLDIDVGQLIRTETDPKGNAITSVVADKVPYHYIENTTSYWGFMVSRNGSALTLSLSRFADSGVNTTRRYQNVSDKSFASQSLLIETTSGVYFLRNPQAVIVLN